MQDSLLAGTLHIALAQSWSFLGRLQFVTTFLELEVRQLYLFAHAGLLGQSESLSNSWMVVDTPDAATPHQNSQIDTQPESPPVLSMLFHQAQHKGKPSSIMYLNRARRRHNSSNTHTCQPSHGR